MEQKIKEQILAIRDTGLTNMFDIGMVQRLAYKEACPMMFIRDDDLKLAFTIMMNKLIFSGKVILKPYVEGIRSGSTDDSFHRMQELTTQLAKNTEQRENLQKLAAQGFIDKILFNTETNKLLSNADDFRKEIEALNNTVSSDVSKVTAATDLLHFAEKGEMLHGFDEELFEKHVRQITVKNRTEFSFELKCGLCLTERI